MKNDTLIPVYDITNCIPGGNFIIKHCEGTEVPQHITTPHRSTGYNISLLLEGDITHYTDFRKFTATAPALILLAPEQVHQRTGNSYYKMKQLMFSNDFLLSETQGELACWECMFESVVVPLHDNGQLQQLITYVELMEFEFNERRPQQEIILRNLLNAFIISAARSIRLKGCVRQMDSNQNKIVRQFKMLADQHYLETTQVGKYADMLFVTPGHLNDLIKSVTGKTAKQIIDEKRVMEAKRLLFWGELSVKQIAGHLNFEDDAYFNRFFKKHTGQTPALFQKTTREKYNNSPNLVNPILFKAS